MCKYRISTHVFNVENLVNIHSVDEFHFVIVCPTFSGIREKCIKPYYYKKTFFLCCLVLITSNVFRNWKVVRKLYVNVISYVGYLVGFFIFFFIYNCRSVAHLLMDDRRATVPPTGIRVCLLPTGGCAVCRFIAPYIKAAILKYH